jgi:ankyrin repeat protein
MSLSNLPREIVLGIADYLDDAEINALACTNSQVYDFLNRHLYRGDVTRFQFQSKSLSWAAELGVEGTIKQAINAGEHFNPIPSSFDTALQLAAYHGHVRLVELLLEVENINLNYRGRIFKRSMFRSTPLGCAAKMGHSDIVQLLLAEDDVDPNIADESYSTPLCWACEMGHVSIVRQLLAQDDVYIDGISGSKSPLIMACFGGHVEIINLLLAQDGIDVNFQYCEYTALMVAVEKRLVEVVKSLLARNDVKPNITCRNKHVLEAAMYLEDAGMMKLLLDHPDIDPNYVTIGSYSLLMCIMRPFFHMTEPVLRLDMVKLLLGHERIDVNYQDSNGWTALNNRAASYDQFEIAKLLLEREDIDINLPNNCGETPLFSSRARLADLLLKKRGIDPNIRDVIKGHTPLTHACRWLSVDKVRLLLSCPDTDLNAVDNNGVSILTYLINTWHSRTRHDGSRYYEIKSLLCAAGATT